MEKGYPFSSVRTSRSPCNICGGFDPNMTTNYTYPDKLLPGVRGNFEEEAEKEYQGAPTSGNS
jgi:hypothetical protein